MPAEARGVEVGAGIQLTGGVDLLDVVGCWESNSSSLEE